MNLPFPKRYYIIHRIIKSNLKIFVSLVLFAILITSTPSSINAQNSFNEEKMFNKPTQNSPYPIQILDRYNSSSYQYYENNSSRSFEDYNVTELRNKCINYEELPKELLSKFDVVAVKLDILYNKYGQHDPNGAMYVLQDNLGKVKDESKLNSEIMKEIAILKDLKDDKKSPEYIQHVSTYKKLLDDKKQNKTLIEPLTIRTNIGKCVEIELENKLNVTASMHPTGLSLDPNKSDGLVVGNNNSTVVSPGSSIVYRWFPEAEGSYFFTDGAKPVVQTEDLKINPTDVKKHGLKSSNAEVQDIEKEILNNRNDNEEADINAGPERSLRQHGLFGALIVEPEGTWWTDPLTSVANKPLTSGVKADVHFPDSIRNDSREFVVFYHDGAEIKNTVAKSLTDKEKKDQEKILVPSKLYGLAEEGSLYTINYRGDSVEERTQEGEWLECPLCHEEQYFYSSWVHGDPGLGDLVFPGYVGDPIKFITVGAQVEENHVHHLHNHRWKSDPAGNWSNTIDSQPINPGNTNINPFHVSFGKQSMHNNHTIPGGDFSVNPSMTYAESLKVGGLGYAHHNTGDVLFHCHLFPHYGSGMWGIMRAYDKLQTNSDGKIILQPLEGNNPVLPTKDQPGFPKFIGYPVNSTFSENYTESLATKGQPVPHPPDPNGNADGRNYSKLEIMASNYFNQLNKTIGDKVPKNEVIRQAIENSKPGAPMIDPCPPNTPERHYDVDVINKDMVYNKYGDHDPYGRMFVISNDTSAQDRNYTGPLILRGNLGECVTVTLTNNLIDDLEHNRDNTNDGIPDGLPISMHIHFVSFDVLGSDGTVVGYNYDEGTYPVNYPENRQKYNLTMDEPNYQNKIDYRYYYDEQGNVFFHDHNSGIIKGMHGTGGMLVIEPKNSTWYDGDRYKDNLTKTLWKLSGDETSDGKIVNSSTGSHVIVRPGNGDEQYREYVLFYQDFVEMYDKKGFPINFKEKPLNGDGQLKNPGAPLAESFHDHGSMAINYKNEPLYQRYLNSTNKDPSKIFSSLYYGDPSTPMLQSYPGEKVLVRFIQTGHEEMHNFNMHGFSWPQEITNPYSENVSNQPISVSEQFSFLAKIRPIAGIINDHLYASYASDDLWNGMWGINRIWCNPINASEVLNTTQMAIGDDQYRTVNISKIPIPIKNLTDYPKCVLLPIEIVEQATNATKNATKDVNKALEASIDVVLNTLKNENVQNIVSRSLGTNNISSEELSNLSINQINDLANITSKDRYNEIVSASPELLPLRQKANDSVQLLNSTLEKLNNIPSLKSNNVALVPKIVSKNDSIISQLADTSVNNNSLNLTNAEVKPIKDIVLSLESSQLESNQSAVIVPGLSTKNSAPPLTIKTTNIYDKSNLLLEPPKIHPDLLNINTPKTNYSGVVPTCPPDVLTDGNITTFDITAINTSIKYNKYGDYDNDGVVYVLSKDKDKINTANETIDPLVIRANKGQCIVVNLSNDISVSDNHTAQNKKYTDPFLPNECQPHLTDSHIRMNPITKTQELYPGSCFPPKEWKPSNSISLHPNNLNYNVLLSDGTNVGYNYYENTASPSETRTYVYYASQTGSVVLSDMADFKSNRHHGAYGLLIIEPANAVYMDKDRNIFSGNEISTPEAYIQYASEDGGNKTFHEYALLFADGVPIDRIDNQCPIDIDEEEFAGISCNQSPLDDPEEQGFFGINYKSEPLKWRLIEDVNYHNGGDSPYPIEFSHKRTENSSIIPENRVSLLFSTKLGNHTDPNTPVVNTTLGENVVLRIADVADKPRGFTIHVGGHLLMMPSPLAHDLPMTDNISKVGVLGRDTVNLEEGVTPALTVGKAIDVELVGQAGGLQNKTSDYIYKDMKLERFVEGGVWGIIRVNNGTSDNIQ